MAMLPTDGGPETLENDRLRNLGIGAYSATRLEGFAASAEEAWATNPMGETWRALRYGARQPGPVGVGAEFGAEGVGPDVPSERMLTVEEANERYGIKAQAKEDSLSFDTDIAESLAQDIHDAKRRELMRKSVRARAPRDVTQFAAELAVGFGVSALDPLNVASAFIPVVGPTRYALALERAGASAAARAATRARLGAIEGAVGAVAVEPLVLAGASLYQQDYDALDSLLNIAFGAALGGGLHASAGVIGDRIAQARLQEPALRGAVAAVVEDRPVRLDTIIPDEILNPPAVAARRAFPEDFPEAVIHTNAETVQRQTGFDAAKLGDITAARDVVGAVLKEEALGRVAALAGSDAIVVPVRPAEGNAIPTAYAEALAERLGLEVDKGIVKAPGPRRRELAGMERFATPVSYEGPVRAGRNYIIADDHLTQGGTVAALRAHIEAGGGRVVGVTTLSASRGSRRLAPTAERLAKTREGQAETERFFRARFGYGFDALTDSELAAMGRAPMETLAAARAARPMRQAPEPETAAIPLDDAAMIRSADAIAARVPDADLNTPEAAQKALDEVMAQIEALDPAQAAAMRAEGEARTQGAEAARAPETEAAVEPPPFEPGANLVDPSTGARARMVEFAGPEIDDIQVDAKRFQFKAGGDESGVIERLQGVETFDPILAGDILVWEQRDGQLFVADGHQRVGLAKRLMDQSPVLRGTLLREADGITAEKARAIAGLKNIAQGTGTAIDAAKLMRGILQNPELRAELPTMPPLPPRSALVRDAEGLARLGDDAFGMVVNEIVDPVHAAHVGRLIIDPAEQKAALDVLAKVKPASTAEALSIVRDLREQGFQRGTEASLFGEEQIAQGLYLERARVLAEATRQLRRDKAVFRTLVDESGRITEAVNQLAKDANFARMSDDERLAFAISTLANRKGPISDALSARARELQSGGARAAVGRGFLDDVRARLQAGLEFGEAGAAGRPAAEPAADGGQAGDQAGSVDQRTMFSLRREQAGDVTDTPEFRNWFGDSKVVDESGKPLMVYHGANRAENIARRGKFDRRKATSGPMAFFTDDPAIASKYAEGKPDIDESKLDFDHWFTFPPAKGTRTRQTLSRMWYSLDEAQRAKVKDTLLRAARDDDNEIVFHDEPDGGIASIVHWEYEVRQARGNWLQAARSVWLESGAIFNEEDQFGKILREAGLRGFEFDDPREGRPGVLPVYLRIRNPLVTSTMPENVIAALEQAAKGRRAPRETTGLDPWDKRTRNPREWVQMLKAALAEGKNSFVWSSIPDWVTDTLRRMGYDGIRDTGGKMGGEGHDVWIPFSETQVKSAFNRGTFDPGDPRISYRIGDNPTYRPDFRADYPDKVETALMSRMKQVGIADKIMLKVVKDIRSRADGTLTTAEGAFYDRIIEVALTARDTGWTLDHEIVHGLRSLKLFKDAEWEKLAAAARADKLADGRARIDEIRNRYKDQKLTDEQIVEEAVADMFADWSAKRTEASGFLKALFEKIAALFKALKAGFSDAGYKTLDDIFEGVERGYVGRRAPDAVTSTTAFKTWFGDSKIVDQSGEPLVVYHGTDRDLTEFRGEGDDKGGMGIYFTKDPDYADVYRGKGNAWTRGAIYPVYLSIKNPKVIDDFTFWEKFRVKVANRMRGRDATNDPWDMRRRYKAETTSYLPEAEIRKLEEQGFDGIINEKMNEIVAFRPEQIKSATGNRGTFDPADSRIAFSIRDDEPPSLFPTAETVDTADGPMDQFVLPGGERISQREMLERRGQGSLKAKKPQKAPGGLFGAPEPEQLDLLRAADENIKKAEQDANAIVQAGFCLSRRS